MLPEAAAAIVSPAIALDATVERDGDRIDLNLVASSPALAFAGSGGLDIEESRLIGLRADISVRQPGLLNPALSGTGMRISLAADGPVSTAPIAWTARADTLRWAADNGPLGADSIRADGQLVRAGAGQPLRMPFSASAGRILGLPPEQAALAGSPRLSGTLVVAGDEVRLPEFALRTARITATGSAVRRADGRVEASLRGEVPRFDVDGLGPVAIRADARIDLPAGGPLAATGRFEARSLGLASAGATDFLGGPPVLAGQFRLASSGDIVVTNASFRSPALVFTDATARYDPASGRFQLDASGAHRDHGPIAIVASGTAAAPTATIRMAKPDFGIGLADLVAEVAPAPAGIAWTVTGETPGGPLAGRGTVDYGDGRPLAIEIGALTLGGVEASGRLVQTAAGPFAGSLAIAGQGIDGTLGFAAEGGHQRIDARATARGARLPLDPPLLINNGRLELSLLLLPDRPTVRGGFEASGVRLGNLSLTKVSGQANLVGTDGAGRIVASGRLGDNQPFAATATVRSIPKGYALTLVGNVGRLPLKLERPAVIARTADGWELQPVRLVLPSGNLVVAGALGETRTLRLVLNDVSLSSVNLVAPGLGLQGVATGQVNVRWDEGYPVPLGAANIAVKGFSRAGVTGLSVPVDLVVSARSSTAEGLLVGGEMRWQGNQLGRLLVRVEPGPGETTEAQWRAGRLSGGVRYNGPVEPLWALAGLEGQELKGPVAIGADVAGTVSAPVLNGIARGRGLLYRNVALGTEIDQIMVEGSFAGPALMISRFEGRTRGGGLSGSGRVNFSGEAGAVDFSLDLKRARLADSDALSVTVSGPLALKGPLSQPVLSGDLRVDDARILLVPLESSEIPVLKVRRAGEARVPPAEGGRAGGNVRFDLRVRADDRVRVEGMGLESLWRADVRVRGTATQPILAGTATLARGDFQFAGNTFDITRGRVVFNGDPLQSSIDIVAETRANDVTAVVRIGGTAINPVISFTSQPPLPEDEILSRLLFGSSVADLSVTEALQLATAIAGLQSGTDTMGKIRRSIGLDRLRLVGDDNAFGMGVGIAIGKRLGRNVYVEVITDSDGNTLAILQWSLSRTLSLLAEISSIGRNSLNLRYQRDY
jgi:translocation and assembly module TamB